MCSFVFIISTDNFALLYGKSNLDCSQNSIYHFTKSTNNCLPIEFNQNLLSFKWTKAHFPEVRIEPERTNTNSDCANIHLLPPFPSVLLLPRLQLSWQCRQNFTNDYRLLALPPRPIQPASHASSHPHTTLELTHSCASWPQEQTAEAEAAAGAGEEAEAEAALAANGGRN